MITLQAMASFIGRSEGKRDNLIDSIEERKKALNFLTNKLVLIEQAQALVQDTAKRTQEQLKIHIEDLVQLALDTCFPGEYQFKVEFEIKRGKTEASLLFYKNGIALDPMEASGGGVVDLAAFALRIASWTLSKTRPTIILDEPFRFLSKDLQPRAGEIISELSKRLGIQFIMVTHNSDMVNSADQVIDVSMVKGKSQVRIRT